MYKNIMILLSGLLLANTAVVYTQNHDSAPQHEELQKNDANKQSYFDRFLKLAGAATSATAGIVIGKTWWNYCAAELAKSQVHVHNMHEHFNDWYAKAYPHAMPDKTIKLPYEFMQGYAGLMPEDHPYFIEQHKARACGLNDGDAIPFVISFVLLVGAGVILYECFAPQQDKTAENEVI